MKSFRPRMSIFALTAVLLLFSSTGFWPHAAASAGRTSDFTIASEGDLDPSFGTGGKLTTDLSNHLDQAKDLAIQPDGRIIVVGRSAVRNDNDDIVQSAFVIMRYNSDGSLDQSFGDNGTVATDFITFPAGANAVALYPDGRFIVAGFTVFDADEDTNFGIARYNSDGSLDTTFDDDGKVITGFFGLNNVAYGVAIQPDGKIIVGGVVGRFLISDSGPEFGVVRYNSNGSLDADFGVGGKATTDFFNHSDQAHDMVLQPDGKIIIAGDIVNLPANTNHDFGIARYNSDGTLDAGFGSGGKVATDFFQSSDLAQVLALQADGKIIVAGEVIGGSDYNFGLARYNSDGSLDNSFGNKGKVVTDFIRGNDSAKALIIQPDGKIIAGGFAATSSSPSFTQSFVALARYKSDGSLDSGFGVNGKMTTDFFGQLNEAAALAMQPDGKLLVAGSAQKGGNNYDIALMRYFAFTPPDFTLALSATNIEAARGKKPKVNLEIGRVGDFTGSVTVSVSDTSASGITVTPNPASTPGTKIKFKLKIKKSAPRETHQITFTGRDDTGRERSATLSITIQ